MSQALYTSATNSKYRRFLFPLRVLRLLPRQSDKASHATNVDTSKQHHEAQTEPSQEITSPCFASPILQGVPF
jgi:hypothetical protein